MRSQLAGIRLSFLTCLVKGCLNASFLGQEGLLLDFMDNTSGFPSRRVVTEYVIRP